METRQLTGALICGILCRDLLGLPSTAALSLTVGLLLVTWLLLRRTFWARMPVLAAFLMLGLILADGAARPPGRANDITHFIDDRPLVLEGRMLGLSTTEGGGSRFDLQVNQVLRHAGEKASASGLVRVSIDQGAAAAVEGQMVRLRCRLRRPENFGSPGEFDYASYLAARNIFTTAHLRHGSELVALAGPDRASPALLHRVRGRIAAAILRAVPPNEAPLVQALVIGLRDGITRQHRRVLSEGGVSHLFAISGLHFGLLGMLLYLCGRWLYSRSRRLLLWCPPRRILPLLLIVPMAGYLLLTGNSLPTRRAFFMATAGALLYSSNRRTHPMCLLSSAALLILLIEPLTLFQPAFQLSFAGLLGILVWLPRWQRPWKKKSVWLRWPVTLLLASLAATLATAPLTLWHFQVVAPAGLVTNLLATPLLAWGAVPIGLCGALLLPITPEGAATCFAASGALVAVALRAVEILTDLPGLSALRHFPCWSDVATLVLLLIALSAWGQTRGRRVLSGILILAGLSLLLYQPSTAPDLRVVALSVGQGDATLLTINQSQHFLIDGGGLPRSRFDTGERLVAPALGRLGVRRLAGVVLTHDHPDHRMGLPFILDAFPVDRFYCGQSADALHPDLRDILRKHRIPVTTLTEGWTNIRVDPTSHLHIFTPRQNHNDLNERSLAVYAQVVTDGVLLTGDMGPSGLGQLFQAGEPGPTTLFKLPHHGSRHSNPGPYLGACKPTIAFVSAGRHNVYGLPHVEVVDFCDKTGIPLYRTDRYGTLVFQSSGRGWGTSWSKKGLFH